MWKTGMHIKIIHWSWVSDYVICMFWSCLVPCSSIRTWFSFSTTHSTPFYADNTSVIKLATNPIFHERAKHIEIDCHYIWDLFEDDTILLPYVLSTFQLAHIFTKTMIRERHHSLLTNWSAFCFSYHQLRGSVSGPQEGRPPPLMPKWLGWIESRSIICHDCTIILYLHI